MNTHQFYLLLANLWIIAAYFVDSTIRKVIMIIVGVGWYALGIYFNRREEKLNKEK